MEGLKRKTGVGAKDLALARRCSTAEILPYVGSGPRLAE